MADIKLDLTNSERLILLKFINEEVRKAQNASNTTVARLEKLYGLQAKMQDKRPVGLSL
jgi:hypothetical protein